MSYQSYMSYLFAFTGTAIVTIWYVEGILTPFIKIALSILACAFTACVTLVVLMIGRLSRFLDANITPLLRRYFPPYIRAELYLLVGLLTFYVDQLYGKELFNENESIIFYHISVFGESLWVSRTATYIGSFFIGLFGWYILKKVVKRINLLLDHPVHISLRIAR